jgi:hypothetical protein
MCRQQGLFRMKWQVFVRVGINNTSLAANNSSNTDAAAATTKIRKALENAKIKKKSKRKTATFRAEVSSQADIQGVVDGLKSMLDTINSLEFSGKNARLDNVWILINREDDVSTPDDHDSGEEPTDD